MQCGARHVPRLACQCAFGGPLPREVRDKYDLTDWTTVETEGITPIEVEKRLVGLVNTLSTALTEWKRLYKEHKDTEREYDAAYARARLAAADAGIQANDRKYHADTDPKVAEAREAMDLAEVAFKYSEQRLRGVHTAISTWQTINRNVQQAYATGGGSF